MQHFLTTGVVLTPAIVNQQEPILRGDECDITLLQDTQVYQLCDMMMVCHCGALQ